MLPGIVPLRVIPAELNLPKVALEGKIHVPDEPHAEPAGTRT